MCFWWLCLVLIYFEVVELYYIINIVLFNLKLDPVVLNASFVKGQTFSLSNIVTIIIWWVSSYGLYTPELLIHSTVQVSVWLKTELRLTSHHPSRFPALAKTAHCYIVPFQTGIETIISTVFWIISMSQLYVTQITYTEDLCSPKQ